jgi:predicted transcriptional regulator
MSKTAVITARLDPETLAGLDEIAGRQDRSRAYLVAKAVREMVEEEAAMRAFVQKGIDSADRDDMISQDDMEAWFAARRHRAAAE